jgi:hypothetical protein
MLSTTARLQQLENYNGRKFAKPETPETPEITLKTKPSKTPKTSSFSVTQRCIHINRKTSVPEGREGGSHQVIPKFDSLHECVQQLPDRPAPERKDYKIR